MVAQSSHCKTELVEVETVEGSLRRAVTDRIWAAASRAGREDEVEKRCGVGSSSVQSTQDRLGHRPYPKEAGQGLEHLPQLTGLQLPL